MSEKNKYPVGNRLLVTPFQILGKRDGLISVADDRDVPICNCFKDGDAKEIIRYVNSHDDLLAALRPIAQACKEMLCQTDPGDSGLTIADCLDAGGETDFAIRLTLAQANAVADAIAKAEGRL